jgi:ribosomal-protein-alanine N-acetyltransferase
MSAADSARLLVLRRAKETDLPEIMPIERASFPTPWSEQGMRRELCGQNGAVYYVAEVDGHVVGYVGAWIYAREVHILTIAVDVTWRGQGLGEILMLTILEHGQQMGCNRAVLEYRLSNFVAEALYRKLGFVAVGIRPGYYTDTNEDAVSAALDDLDAPARREHLAALRTQWEKCHGWIVVSPR